MSDADWKCDLCGRKQGGDTQPPQGWMLLIIPDRYTNLNEERVLCSYCVEMVCAAHLAKLDTSGIAILLMNDVWSECEQLHRRDERDLRGLHNIITAALAPLLEQRRQMVEVLREFRDSIHMICKSEYQNKMLSRIDTILAALAGEVSE